MFVQMAHGPLKVLGVATIQTVAMPNKWAVTPKNDNISHLLQGL